MKKPNFFIVGAPKCGTTAMNVYLQEHPEIFMPKPEPPDYVGKELHYFGSDLTRTAQPLSYENYLSYFSSATSEKAIGEASVWYLYSKLAAKEIYEFCHEAKIIVMLRNPVDLLYSLHSQFLYTGNENLKSFKKALKAESSRKQGKNIPSSWHIREGLYYREVIKFSEQIERYFRLFGQKNVNVIIYEDFANNTESIYRNTLEFLEVNSNFSTNFERVNPNKKVRSKKLTNFLMLPPQSVRLISRVIPKNIRQRLMKKLKQYNTVYTTRPLMESELYISLQKEQLPEIEKLSILLDRDLTHWCK